MMPLESLPHSTAPKPLNAHYAGYQQGYGSLAGYHMWTILDPAGIPGHPCESTVAEQTITEAGYIIIEQPVLSTAE
jgi:hypothetical protein